MAFSQYKGITQSQTLLFNLLKLKFPYENCTGSQIWLCYMHSATRGVTAQVCLVSGLCSETLPVLFCCPFRLLGRFNDTQTALA